MGLKSLKTISVVKSLVIGFVILALMNFGVFAFSYFEDSSQDEQIQTIRIEANEADNAQIEELCSLMKRNSFVLLQYDRRLARLERLAGLPVPKPTPPFTPTRLDCDAYGEAKSVAEVAEERQEDAEGKDKGGSAPSPNTPRTQGPRGTERPDGDSTPDPTNPNPSPTDPTPTDPTPVDPPPVGPTVEPPVKPPVRPPSGPVPVDPVNPINPPSNPVGPIIEPIVGPIIDPILEPIKPIIDPIVKPVRPIVDPITDPVCRIDPILGRICEIL